MHVAVRSRSAGALELIERVMHATGTIAREYPLVFGEYAPGRVVTLQEVGAEGERVLSTCAILVRDLVMPGAGVRVGLIGSVATDPEARGRGLASEVLARAEETLAAEGCLFALLWADDERFYATRGWSTAGTEVDWLVPLELAAALPRANGVREAREADFDALHALYELHSARVVRSREETRALLRVPEMRVLVRERANRLVAYACQGRGRDLQGVVHEWAGAPEDVLALVRAHLEALGNDLALIAPPSARALARPLGALGCPVLQGVLGMAKILRPDLAAELLERLAGEAARVRDLDTSLHVDGPRSSVSLDSLEALAVLLGARGERTAAARLEAATGLDLHRLPIAPFLWGLDSI